MYVEFSIEIFGISAVAVLHSSVRVSVERQEFDGELHVNFFFCFVLYYYFKLIFLCITRIYVNQYKCIAIGHSSNDNVEPFTIKITYTSFDVNFEYVKQTRRRHITATLRGGFVLNNNIFFFVVVLISGRRRRAQSYTITVLFFFFVDFFSIRRKNIYVFIK